MAFSWLVTAPPRVTVSTLKSLRETTTGFPAGRTVALFSTRSRPACSGLIDANSHSELIILSWPADSRKAVKLISRRVQCTQRKEPEVHHLVV